MFRMQGHRIHVPIEVDGSTVAFVSCPSAKPHAISGSVSAQEAMQQGCIPLRLEQGLVNASAHCTLPACLSKVTTCSDCMPSHHSGLSQDVDFL